MLTTSTKDKTHYTPVPIATTLTAGSTYYTSDTGAGEFQATGTEISNGSNYYVYAPTKNSTFKLTNAATTGVPFRPYFTAASNPNPVKGYEFIAIGDISSSLWNEDYQSDGDDADSGELVVKAKRGRIIVKSKLTDKTTVHIYSAAGAVISTFDIEPGQTVETPIHTSGIYLVNKQKVRVDGR